MRKSFRLRFVLGVLAPTDKIFDGATIASAGLAAFIANLSASLFHGYDTDAGFLVAFGVFALTATIFEAFASFVAVAIVITSGGGGGVIHWRLVGSIL